MKLKMIALLTVASFLISCSSIPTSARLKLPPKLTYPIISVADVACLTNESFMLIKKRDKLKTARIETLRNIIKATYD